MTSPTLSQIAAATASTARSNQAVDAVTVESQAIATQVLQTLTAAEELIAGAETPLVAEPTLSVVIPVYNEPVTVLEIVSRVRALPIAKQIIVVNDGSTDGTAETLLALTEFPEVEVLHHEVNRGKGAALQTGFERARGEFVIVQDADLEYDPQDILKVIAPLQSGESQVVFGSRYLEQADQDPSWIHRFGNWALTTMSNVLTGHRLTDMETCYKAFRRDVLTQIHIEQCRFGFEPEITAKLAHNGISIREVGVSYAYRSHDEGKKIGWRDLISAIYCIVRYSLFR
ncbi:MAG: glycosyltransferase family 2 protein [Pirellulaceae bacterium]